MKRQTSPLFEKRKNNELSIMRQDTTSLSNARTNSRHSSPTPPRVVRLFERDFLNGDDDYEVEDRFFFREDHCYSLLKRRMKNQMSHAMTLMKKHFSFSLIIIKFISLLFISLLFCTLHHHILHHHDLNSSTTCDSSIPSSPTSESSCHHSFFFIHAQETTTTTDTPKTTPLSIGWKYFYEFLSSICSFLSQFILTLYQYLLSLCNFIMRMLPTITTTGSSSWFGKWWNAWSNLTRRNSSSSSWWYPCEGGCWMRLSMYLLLLSAIGMTVNMCYRVIQRKYKERVCENEKREIMRKQRLTTLYEILVSERQYCEYLKVLYEQYYLPLEKGDTSCQLEITRTVKNATTVTTSVTNGGVSSSGSLTSNSNHASDVDDSKQQQQVETVEKTTKRSIIDFKSIHTLKDSSMILIPPEIENIYKLNQDFLKCLESEILGWHAKDRFLYNVYRYSMNMIGSLFSKSNTASNPSTGTAINNNGNSNASLSGLASSSSSDNIPSPTSRPLPIPPGVRSPARHVRTGSSSGDLLNGGSIENFGYDLKQVREDCNISEKCFNKFMPAFMIYAFYISKFNQCRMNVNELSNQYPEFQTNLRLAKTHLKPANSLDLASLSVMIPQRLPRYVLLLKQLAKCTNLNELPHQFKEIEQCVKELEKITFKVNAFVKEYHSRMLVVNLQEEINKKVPLFKQEQQDGLIPCLVQPYRKVIYSFKVTPLVISSGGSGSDNDGSASPISNSGLLTPRSGSSSVTSIPSMEIHVLNDVLIVIASKTKTILKTKNEVDSSAVGTFLKLLSPKRKDRHQMPPDIARNETVDSRNVFEIYYCENHNVSLHTSQKASTTNAAVATTNTTTFNTRPHNSTSSGRSSSASDSSDNGDTNHSNTLILELSKCKYYSFVSKSQTKKEEQHSRQLTKIIHLDKTEEMTQLFMQCFEKLERPKTVFTLAEDDEGETLISNSKLLTLLTPENLVLTALNSNNK